MFTALKIVCIVVGLAATLAMLVFLAAAAPNSTGPQSRLLRRLTVGFVLLGVTSFAGALTLLWMGIPGWGCAVALAPAAATALTIAVALVRPAPAHPPIACPESVMTNPDQRSQATWWRRARELERTDQLEAAEAVIRDAIPYQTFALETAELYKDRYLRLREAGRTADAATAFAKAEEWARFYASLATSGGEGLALSAERDEFIESLKRA